MLMRVVQARKKGEQARPYLNRRRAQQIDLYRKKMSGKEGVIKQQSYELQRLSKATRKRICSLARVSQQTVVKKYEMMAFKSRTGLSWSGLSAQRRLLKRLGVNYSSEKEERQERQNILKENLKCLQLEFEERNEEGKAVMKKQASVYVQNLQEYVLDLLDQYDKAGKLCWDNKPKNEVWLKIGGDHGQGTFKVCLQVLNTNNPNSKYNTICIGCFCAKDYYQNLATITELFRNDLEQLKRSYWNEKKIRLFLFGDYAFLTCIYGLSGACGVHCCLFCSIDKSSIGLPLPERQTTPRRTLESIKSDHQSFVSEGKGLLSKAKAFNNVIHAPLWDIPVDYVCPPYLHIMLGIIKKHHQLLEKECHALDESVAARLSRSNSDVAITLSTAFQEHINKIRDRQELSKQLKKKKLALITLQNKTQDKQIRSKRKGLASEIEELALQQTTKQQCKLKLRSGPVTSSLEEVLENNNIIVQAYHSRSFTGNHCRKYIQDKVVKEMGDKIMSVVHSLVSDVDIVKDAECVRSKFTKLNSLYQDVHIRIAHSQYISPEDVEDHQAAINTYMAQYRSISPQILPKHHLLEDHVCQWINAWHHGMGLHGEQGGESIHRQFRRLEALMCSQRNPLKKLKYVMNEHHISTHPKVTGNIIK